MQLKLETNLPVIFLTLLVIAVVVMGYLELKKMNERIKHLEYLNKNKDDKKDIKKPNISENVPPQPVKQETIQEPLQETTESKNANRVEEWQMNNEKENIIDTLNGKDEYIEEINEKDVAVPASVDNLKQIVKDKQNAVFMFKDGKARVDLFSASALMGVYNALKPATRKKFETMIDTKLNELV